MREISCPTINVVNNFYNSVESHRLYQHLFNEQNWPDNRYAIAGRLFTLPRLQTWHADHGIVYSYRNNLLQTRAWTPLLNYIRHKVENYLNFRFNAVLVNLYRNGEDYVGWHSENECELGEKPYIASISFGAERMFAYRQKKSRRTDRIALPEGSLLIMQPEFQRQWEHCLPVDPSIQHGRINLTFRHVIPPMLIKPSIP